MAETKLIRDKIPQIMEAAGKKCKYKKIKTDKEYEKYLLVKLMEELDEFLTDLNVEELVDVMTVMKALLAVNGAPTSLNKIMTTYKKKAEERGEFEERLIATFD